MEHKELSHLVIGAAMEVHRALSSGFLERVYENALAHEFKLRGITFATQVPIQVFYKNVAVGDYIADILAENVLLIELKSVQNLTEVHEVQLVHYLNAMRIETGLLLNFGSPSLQYKRKFRSALPTNRTISDP